jgi:hypothetical protein
VRSFAHRLCPECNCSLNTTWNTPTRDRIVSTPTRIQMFRQKRLGVSKSRVLLSYFQFAVCIICVSVLCCCNHFCCVQNVHRSSR